MQRLCLTVKLTRAGVSALLSLNLKKEQNMSVLKESILSMAKW